MIRHLPKIISALAGLALFAGASASASAIIDNGTVQLGVDDFGQLNIPGGAASPIEGTTFVGLRYLPTGNEATSHGCLCEGWGVGIADSGVFGWANNDDGSGTSNLSLISFNSDATSATSVVELTSGELRITHTFTPAPETPNLYRVTVTIENISGGAINDVRYTRAMDWDVEPDTFDEFVTIGGTAAATAVLLATDDGFDSTNPFAAHTQILASGDFVDSGPADHGALFDFTFGSLAAGESISFDIYYGAAGTELAAFAALAAVGAEVFSFGQCSSDPNGLGLDGPGGQPCNTFIFAFSGVGGEPVMAPAVPVPGAIPLLLTGLAGIGFASRRKKKSA